jgi:hypothetical protein
MGEPLVPAVDAAAKPDRSRMKHPLIPAHESVALQFCAVRAVDPGPLRLGTSKAAVSQGMSQIPGAHVAAAPGGEGHPPKPFYEPVDFHS